MLPANKYADLLLLRFAQANVGSLTAFKIPLHLDGTENRDSIAIPMWLYAMDSFCKKLNRISNRLVTRKHCVGDWMRHRTKAWLSSPNDEAHCVNNGIR